ncbi:YhcH/YjgK/YiaL family protein [Paenibacillus xanthanilyticus]|uniref:YhcH/YjgK/YiaL family protein n=1 Tax=Paenibacillus xanthanilyticus TaxID=1783531 RepID=A0ABV8JTX7_9BACL
MMLGWLADASGRPEYAGLEESLAALRSLAADDWPEGKTVIDGDRLYATIMKAAGRLPDELPAEAHERYIDVHLLLEGEETIGWSPRREPLSLVKPYDEEADYLLAAPAPDEVMLKLSPGMFAVFYPWELHRPGLGGGVLKKAVLKQRIDT